MGWVPTVTTIVLILLFGIKHEVLRSQIGAFGDQTAVSESALLTQVLVISPLSTKPSSHS